MSVVDFMCGNAAWVPPSTMIVWPVTKVDRSETR